MKGITRIKILSVVFVLLAIVAYFSLQEKFTTDTIEKEDGDFAIADTASIEKISIEKDGQTQVLTKDDRGVWKINNKFEVRSNVKDLLLTGLHLLEVKRPVSEDLKVKANEELTKNGTKVTVYYADQVKTMRFARNESDVNTTYLMGEHTSVPLIGYVPGVPGDINNIFKLKEHEWRNRNLFVSNPGSIQQIKVKYDSDPKGDFEIRFQGGNFVLEGVSQLDTSKLEQYISMYQYVPVSGYILPGDSSFNKTKKYATIDLVDINASKSNSIHIYNLSADKKNYFAELGKTGEAVTVNKEIFDMLLIKKAYFIKK